MSIDTDSAEVARYHAIVMRLPALEREVFLLHCFQELEYQEITCRLGLSIDIVQHALARALAKIDLELGH